MNRACRSLEATSTRRTNDRQARVPGPNTKTALGLWRSSAPLKAGNASRGPFFLPDPGPVADPGFVPVAPPAAPVGLAPGVAPPPLAGAAAAAPGLAALAAGLTPAPVALLSVWLPPPCQAQGVVAVSRSLYRPTSSALGKRQNPGGRARSRGAGGGRAAHQLLLHGLQHAATAGALLNASQARPL